MGARTGRECPDRSPGGGRPQQTRRPGRTVGPAGTRGGRGGCGARCRPGRACDAPGPYDVAADGGSQPGRIVRSAQPRSGLRSHGSRPDPGSSRAGSPVDRHRGGGVELGHAGCRRQGPRGGPARPGGRGNGRPVDAGGWPGGCRVPCGGSDRDSARGRDGPSSRLVGAGQRRHARHHGQRRGAFGRSGAGHGAGEHRAGGGRGHTGRSRLGHRRRAYPGAAGCHADPAAAALRPVAGNGGTCPAQARPADAGAGGDGPGQTCAPPARPRRWRPASPPSPPRRPNWIPP